MVDQVSRLEAYDVWLVGAEGDTTDEVVPM